jgi:hypothetical protein
LVGVLGFGISRSERVPAAEFVLASHHVLQLESAEKKAKNFGSQFSSRTAAYVVDNARTNLASVDW